MSLETGMEGKIEEGDILEGYGYDKSSEGQDQDEATEISEMKEIAVEGTERGDENVSEKLDAKMAESY